MNAFAKIHRMGYQKLQSDEYLWIEFRTYNDRADFSSMIEGSTLLDRTGYNTGEPFYRLSWKLSEIEEPGFILQSEPLLPLKGAI